MVCFGRDSKTTQFQLEKAQFLDKKQTKARKYDDCPEHFKSTAI